jgi:hypothetical protein
MIKNAIEIIAVVVTSMFILPGCYKTATVVINNEQAVTRPVSLATDIIPLFSRNCTASGCHNTGGHVPDLTASRAYNSLINGNYVNSATPDKSEIYLWLSGKKSTAMPMGAANNPSNINQLVLAWIKQGAKNN